MESTSVLIVVWLLQFRLKSSPPNVPLDTHTHGVESVSTAIQCLLHFLSTALTPVLAMGLKLF